MDTIFALLLWGLWAFFPKLSQRHLADAWSGVLYQYAGSIAVVVVVAIARGSAMPEWNARGAGLAALAGAAATGGMLFYYRACASTAVSVVAATTALYPIVTIALAWPVLGEALSGRQWLGVGCAALAFVLLSPR